MSLEEFAQSHGLDPNWIELRIRCNQIVGQPDFWYRKDLRDSARELAVEASDILKAAHSGPFSGSVGQNGVNRLL